MLTNTGSGVGRAVSLVRSLGVVVRRGAVDLRRPDLAVRSVVAAHRFGPLVGVIAGGLHRDEGAIAVIDERGAATFGEIDGTANALARLLADLGIAPGDVIAVLCRDHRELVTVAVAANKAGVRLVLMNTGFAAPQLAEVAERENVRLVVADEEFLGLLASIRESTPRLLAWAERPAAHDAPILADLMQGYSQAPVPAPPKPGGLVLLTSGTTGTPKGAPRDRVSPLVTAQVLDRVPVPRDSTVVLGAPMFHATGLAMASLALALGSSVAVQRRFDPEWTLQTISDHGAEMVVLVPTMLERILALGPETLARYDVSSLKVLFCAGSPMSPDLYARATKQFGDVLYNLYGSTEVAVAAVATPEDLRAAPGTVGRPPVGCRVALFDDHDTEIVTPGVVGRIFVRSVVSFSGYTDGRHKVIIDGLMSTGDLGTFDDDGRWFVVGREDDMIVSGGENVHPLEIENLLNAHPEIADAAVVGVDDVEFGTRLRAFVMCAPGAHITENDVRCHVRSNLARFKVPREVIFVDELPRNATGKLLRGRLEAASTDSGTDES